MFLFGLWDLGTHTKRRKYVVQMSNEGVKNHLGICGGRWNGLPHDIIALICAQWDEGQRRRDVVFVERVSGVGCVEKALRMCV